MSTTEIVILSLSAYFGSGFSIGMGRNSYLMRQVARRGHKTPKMDWEEFWGCFWLWPCLLFILSGPALEWGALKMARVDKLPEVQARKQKALEKAVLDD